MFSPTIRPRRSAPLYAVNAPLDALLDLRATTASALRCTVTQGGYRGVARRERSYCAAPRPPPVALELGHKSSVLAQIPAQLARGLLQRVELRGFCAVFRLIPNYAP